MFLHNQRRHPGVISLLTTTIMSLSLNILSCYQTNLIVVWRLAGRASIFWHSPPGVARMLWIHPQGVLSFLFRQRWRELRRPRCLGDMNSWRTFFRRPSFVVQTKILYCETTITLKISFWCQKLSQFVRKIVSQNKAKNADVLGKMRDVLGKMRECAKYVKMRDFPHDCGRVDTYELHTLA